MSDDIRDSILPAIRKLAGAADGCGTTDAELLRRWLRQRDEAAFELIVWRHAALVLGVCRQILRDPHRVEDAFQATFLVLIRKAGAISRGDSLPSWLHRVAFHVALRARREPRLDDLGSAAEPIAPEGTGLDADVRRMLHEEVLRLPAKYRLPVVACYLEGKTHEEAADELGWPKGTVAGRLARARELLRRRLARRGVEPESALSGVLPAAAGWSAQAQALLGTIRVVAMNPSAAAGLRGPAADLAEGVIQEMFWSKMRWAALGVLGLSLVGLMSVLAAPRPAPEAMAVQKEAPKDVAEKKNQDPVEEALNRARVRRQMRAIGAAVRNYRDMHGHLPPPAITDAKGKPLLSWRVALLPFLEEDNLSKQFQFDEPWDGPNNRKLLARMPGVFAPVGKTAKANTTFHQYLVGPTAVFTTHRLRTPANLYMPGMGSAPGGGMVGMMPPGGMVGMPPGGRMMPPGGEGAPPGAGGNRPGGGVPDLKVTFRDGEANTLLVVEAGSPVEWTKPDDVPYDPKKPMPRFGGQFAAFIHAVAADGSVLALPKRLPEKTLRAAVTPAGGEELDLVKVAGGRATAGSGVREATLDRLRQRNARLRDEAAVLKETLAELQEDVRELGWAVEKERLLKADPEAAALVKENAALEEALKEARDEAKELLGEVSRLKKQLEKKSKK